MQSSAAFVMYGWMVISPCSIVVNTSTMLTSGLIPIHSLSLVPDTCVGANVYLWNEQKGEAVKCLATEQLVDLGTHSFLLANPGKKVFIEDTSIGQYHDYLNDNLGLWIEDARVPGIVKLATLVESVHAKLSHAFLNKTTSGFIATCEECATLMSQYGPSIRVNGSEVLRGLRHDSSFVTHAINTAYYALKISNVRGYQPDLMSEICVGGMLHDFGKIERLLTDMNSSPSQSASQDWTERNLKSHPTEGFRRLSQVPTIKETYLLMCYQHHERLDGKGFPVGLLADEIHEAAKICAVANRFDGLTSKRAERQPMTRVAALRVMESERMTVLDKEAFRCLDQQLS